MEHQTPFSHTLDATILSGGVAFVLGILPDVYSILSIILVIMGIAWYARQFYLSFKKKDK